MNNAHIRMAGADAVVPDLYTGEPPVESAHKCWEHVQKDLAYALGANVHRAWTARLHIAHADEFTVTLTAQSRFIAAKIESQYIDEVRRLWRKHDLVVPPRRVEVIAPEANLKSAAPSQPASGAIRAAVPSNDRTDVSPFEAAKTRRSARHMTPAASAKDTGGRQDRFTFENFVVGPTNEFAHAAARSVAGNIDITYNPVVIYGAHGMGKTHLLYAIQQMSNEQTPDRRVKKISGEQFVSAFVNSFRGDSREKIEKFKSELRDVDLLLIDDAHFVTNKRGSEGELLMTLVSLVSEGRQIVLSMDRHPDELDEASERLKSYLKSGLVCQIGPTDFDLRTRILDRLIAYRRENGHPNLVVPEQAKIHLAGNEEATPRDLEGVFNQVLAAAQFLGRPFTIETIRETLSSHGFKKNRPLTVDLIQRTVCEEFGLKMDDMASKRRSRAVARPRQVAMYLCKKMTRRSLPDIGRRFGGRDHATVIYAVKKITELRAEDKGLDEQICRVEDSLKKGG